MCSHNNPYHKPSILLVEDSLEIQMVHSRLLQEIGCNVKVADTVKSAWENYLSEPFDLIFLDIGLPDANGFELAKLIRSEEKNDEKAAIPLIMLSSYSSDNSKEIIESLRINDYLIKPINRHQIKSVLKRWVKLID